MKKYRWTLSDSNYLLHNTKFRNVKLSSRNFPSMKNKHIKIIKILSSMSCEFHQLFPSQIWYLVFLFWDKDLCSPGWPQTYCVANFLPHLPSNTGNLGASCSLENMLPTELQPRSFVVALKNRFQLSHGLTETEVAIMEPTWVCTSPSTYMFWLSAQRILRDS